MSRYGLALALLLMLVGLSLGAAPSAEAQKTTLPESVVKVSKEMPIITGQLRMAITYGQRALAILETGGASQPIEVAVQHASDCYVLIRAARAGMEQNKASKRFQDPLLDLAYERTTRAWNLARAPVDQYYNGLSQDAYLAVAIPPLQHALGIVEQVLLVLP